MYFDTVSGRVQCEAYGPAGDARYEWDGATWQHLPGLGRVGYRHAYDTRRNALLMYDDDDFRIETATPAVTENYGTGCGGAGLATTLTAFGVPRLGNGKFAIDLRAAATNQPALIT